MTVEEVVDRSGFTRAGGFWPSFCGELTTGLSQGSSRLEGPGRRTARPDRADLPPNQSLRVVVLPQPGSCLSRVKRLEDTPLTAHYWRAGHPSLRRGSDALRCPLYASQSGRCRALAAAREGRLPPRAAVHLAPPLERVHLLARRPRSERRTDSPEPRDGPGHPHRGDARRVEPAGACARQGELRLFLLLAVALHRHL